MFSCFVLLSIGAKILPVLQCLWSVLCLRVDLLYMRLNLFLQFNIVWHINYCFFLLF